MIEIDGAHLTFDEVWRVAARNEPVQLSQTAIEAMQRSRAVVESLAAGDDAVYAVNTGVGLLADMRVPLGDLEHLQRNVIRSHACGVGPPLAAG